MSSQISNQIVHLLRAAVREYGSATALSEEIGISQSGISRIVAGHRRPTARQLDILARHFGLRLHKELEA